MFGVNFADGRIKGYPADSSIGKKYYVLYVRGNTAYGTNSFVDNGDATITDNATGLMWMKNDNGTSTRFIGSVIHDHWRYVPARIGNRASCTAVMESRVRIFHRIACPGIAAMRIPRYWLGHRSRIAGA